MKKAGKILLITAACLILLGGGVFCLVMAANNWDFNQLGSGKFETNTYDIDEDFRSVSIRTDTEDILFSPSKDGKCSVVCYENDKDKHIISVQDGTLSIRHEEKKNWYDHITFFSFDSPKITVYLPETEYESLSIEESTGEITIPKDFTFGSIDISASTGNMDCGASSAGLLRIHTSTGDIRLTGVSAGKLDLSVSTGHIEAQSIACDGDMEITVSTGKANLADVSCSRFSSTGSTGDISLKNVVAEELISIRRSTGDVSFENSDAAELTIETDTGKVSGSLRSPKVFIARSDTGKIDVPETTEGGKCKITTDTGSIRIEIVDH